MEDKNIQENSLNIDNDYSYKEKIDKKISRIKGIMTFIIFLILFFSIIFMGYAAGQNNIALASFISLFAIISSGICVFLTDYMESNIINGKEE